MNDLVNHLRTAIRITSTSAALCLAAAITLSAYAPIAPAAGTITYVGVIRDQSNFQQLKIGNAGYWFPQFAATKEVSGRPTDENVRDALPPWVTPLNHVTNFLDPAYLTRTFSQDGPARSKGGMPTWNVFTLPSGEKGQSGAIVDPFARKNTNNTINRIQLRGQVPNTFFFHVVTDNTNREHDPTIRLRARGNCRGVDIEADTAPQAKELTFNGVADIYTFRCDGFQAGDFLKVRLNGESAGGPSLGGFMFDTAPGAGLIFEKAQKSGDPLDGPPPR
jgi:hypothetical protein